MVRSFESRSARFLSLTIRRFLAFSSSFTMRRLSSLESLADTYFGIKFRQLLLDEVVEEDI